MKNIKVSLKYKKRKKSDNMVEKDTKIYQKMRKQSCLIIEKKENEKIYVVIIIRNYFYLENLVSFLGLCEMCRQV